MEHDDILKYLDLRKAGKLGPVWVGGELIEFSDVEDILSRRVLPQREYRKLISYWYPTNQKEHEHERPERRGPERDSRSGFRKNPVFFSKTG